MEKHTIDTDITTFGTEVKNFPMGIGQAFDDLKKILPNADNRTYYGISYCTPERVTYIAAAEESFDGEGAKYNLKNYVVAKGEYIAETISDWPSKIMLIRDVFAELSKASNIDAGKPLVEVYKNMQEMVCMIKILDTVKDDH
jgi:hypothetical protein